MGRAQGFRPDPGTGALGLELELTPEVVDDLGANVRSVWVPEDKVMAVRKDRMTLDLSLEELRRLVRRLRPPTGLEETNGPGPLEA